MSERADGGQRWCITSLLSMGCTIYFVLFWYSFVLISRQWTANERLPVWFVHPVAALHSSGKQWLHVPPHPFPNVFGGHGVKQSSPK
jgi:hypothetical protein